MTDHPDADEQLQKAILLSMGIDKSTKSKPTTITNNNIKKSGKIDDFSAA